MQQKSEELQTEETPERCRDTVIRHQERGGAAAETAAAAARNAAAAVRHPPPAPAPAPAAAAAAAAAARAAAAVAAAAGDAAATAAAPGSRDSPQHRAAHSNQLLLHSAAAERNTCSNNHEQTGKGDKQKMYLPVFTETLAFCLLFCLFSITTLNKKTPKQLLFKPAATSQETFEGSPGAP